MATYAIGDIQSCYQPFKRLLDKIEFDPRRDRLWLAGDLINRGPDTLQTLREIYRLDREFGCITAVLGNHDLHFLALAYGCGKLHPSDTLTELLDAPERAELVDWLRQCKLVHTDQNLGYSMVHAGIAPQWSIAKANQLARELEAVIQSDACGDFLAHMYGDQPDLWRDDLHGFERWRAITNAFTRMRFCDSAGRLDLRCKAGPKDAPAGLAPWFAHPERAASSDKIIFGHWAALEGDNLGIANIYPLDTGCVWGGKLTALRLEDERRFQVDA